MEKEIPSFDSAEILVQIQVQKVEASSPGESPRLPPSEVSLPCYIIDLVEVDFQSINNVGIADSGMILCLRTLA